MPAHALQIASDDRVKNLLTKNGTQVSIPLSWLYTNADLTPVTFKVLRGGVTQVAAPCCSQSWIMLLSACAQQFIWPMWWKLARTRRCCAGVGPSSVWQPVQAPVALCSVA
jgi:hypothetical protein